MSNDPNNLVVKVPPNPPTTPESTTPANSQSSPPTNPPTPDFQAQIGLYERLLQDLQAENARLKTTVQSPPPPPPAKVNAENFFQNPTEVFENFRTVLMNDVNQSIAPLNQFRAQMERQNAYVVNKTQVEQLIPAHLKPYWPSVAQRLDYAANAGQIQDVSIQGILSAFNYLVGSMMMQGQLPIANTQQVQNPSYVPPNIPSSPPPPVQPTTQLRALTENEKLVARAAGMDDATYLKSLEGSVMVIPPRQAGK